MDYQDINAKTIDLWIENGWEWGKPIDHETYINALNGNWDVLLTPNKKVPKDLYEDTNSFGILHDRNIPTFRATLSVKK